MKNIELLFEKLILKQIEEQSHTQTSFSKYGTTVMLNKYSDMCIMHPCRTCGHE